MSQLRSVMQIAAVCAAFWAASIPTRGVGYIGLLAAANAQSAGGENGRAPGGDEQKGAGQEKPKTPEERMQARFPQPVRVGHLIGLPILDPEDSTIGYVQAVVRAPNGKISLITPYGKRFGWAHEWWPLNVGRRLVAVPIEVVAILALQIDALVMARGDFDKAPTWNAGFDQAVPSEETIKIALGRR